MAVSYDPLWKKLIDFKMNKTNLCDPPIGISRSTLAKMSKGEYVALSVLENICLTLGCPIEDVVKIIPGEKGTHHDV